MAAGDRYIDCNNVPYESVESLMRQLIRVDDDGNTYINVWASGIDPSTIWACGDNMTLTDLFYSLLVYDDDGNLAIASFGT